MRSNPFHGIIIGAVCGSIMWLAGCRMYDAAIVAIHDSIDEALTNAPAVSLTNLPSVKQPSGVDISGEVIDPIGYTAEGVAANAHYEECHIEPSTGLMVRVPVWRPSVGGWWMLSSLFEGQVKRDGAELVCNNFVKNGMAVEVIGFTDYEIHSNENPDTVRYLVKGNRCPYTGARRYIVSRVHKEIPK